MKRILLLFILTSTFVSNCFSQDKGYIAFSFGSSTPIGDFASKDPNNDAAGYAKSGLSLDISMGIKFGKHLGMSALFRGQANSTETQAIADQITKQNPGISGTVESNAWSIGGYMIGGYGSFPISEKVSFDTKVMFGFLTATSPEILLNLNGPGGTAWIKQHSSSSSTFAYLVSAGFKYDVGNRVCLLANFDYLGANPEFNNVETTTSNNGSSKTSFSQSFGTINLGIGIGYRL